jgi:alcohol dehydrogenase
VLGIVNQPGAFAEFVVVPESNLHEIPTEIATEQAVFIEPLAAACEILDQVTIEPGTPVAVLGDGKLGLLIAQVLHTHGLHVMHYGRHADKLEISKERGIETSTCADRPRKEFSYVVDATGSAEGLREAVAMCRPRGTVILKSTVHGEVPIDTAPVIVDELTLIGSRCGRFAPAIALLASGRVYVDALIAGEFPLSEAPAAFQKAAEKGTLKILLKP